MTDGVDTIADDQARADREAAQARGDMAAAREFDFAGNPDYVDHAFKVKAA